MPSPVPAVAPTEQENALPVLTPEQAEELLALARQLYALVLPATRADFFYWNRDILAHYFSSASDLAYDMWDILGDPEAEAGIFR